MVEGEEIFETSASPSDDDHIDPAVDPLQGLHDLEVGLVALHRGRRDHDLEGKPACDDVPDVLEDGPSFRGHHADSFRKAGQLLLSRCLKKPLGSEHGLPFLDEEVLLSLSRVAEIPDIELVAPLGCIVADRTERNDIDAVPELESEPLGIGPPHHALDEGGGSAVVPFTE